MTAVAKVIDLQGGRHAAPVWVGTAPQPPLPAGVCVTHGDHAVSVFWAGPQRIVDLVSLVPLTLEGGYVCTCGESGTVYDGTWYRW